MTRKNFGGEKKPILKNADQAQAERLDKLLDKLKGKELFPESKARARAFVKDLQAAAKGLW